MLSFSGAFVNTDGLSGQVNPTSSNKDPQSISKPIAFSNIANCTRGECLLLNWVRIDPGLAVKAKKSSLNRDSQLVEKFVFSPNVFAFKLALVAPPAFLDDLSVLPVYATITSCHKMQRSKTYFLSAKLQYCSKFLTKAGISV